MAEGNPEAKFSPEAEADAALLLEWFSKFDPSERESFGCDVAMWIQGCDSPRCSQCVDLEKTLERLTMEPRERGQCLDAHPHCEQKLLFKCQMEVFKVMWARWSQEDRKAFQDLLAHRYPMFFCWVDYLIARYNSNAEELKRVTEEATKYRLAGLQSFSDDIDDLKELRESMMEPDELNA